MSIYDGEAGPYGLTITPDGSSGPAFGPSPEEVKEIKRAMDCGCHPGLRAMLGGLLRMAEIVGVEAAQ